ncbi:MAG: VWA domain-containing protein [Oscillospiraceae bacterium]|nr:VWA domain-containing protein [Oscillospiraceae bacterium]
MKTEIVFILDRSGSMAGLESDTIGGYNSMLAKQKSEPGEAVVTTVLFDDKYELLHDRADIRAISPMTEREYYVRGCTALLDAIGKTVKKIDAAQKNILPEFRADKVIFIITTDGLENASREYSYASVSSLIEQAKRERGWEFLFLGANIDAAAEGGRLGISPDRTVRYRPDRRGTLLNYEAMNEAVTCVRHGASIKSAWKKKIEEHFNSGE